VCGAGRVRECGYSYSAEYTLGCHHEFIAVGTPPRAKCVSDCRGCIVVLGAMLHALKVMIVPMTERHASTCNDWGAGRVYTLHS
jgi:hypothetical protein